MNRAIDGAGRVRFSRARKRRRRFHGDGRPGDPPRVAAMGDGVERAIARAGELETLVANEVAALERAYSDNEVRIRALLQDIAHQRDIWSARPSSAQRDLRRARSTCATTSR